MSTTTEEAPELFSLAPTQIKAIPKPTLDVGDIIDAIFKRLSDADDIQKIEAINDLKRALHSISPFHKEPVDCVLWFPNESVVANLWNPNSVAPPEMQLLEVSILQDGYTQPIVGMKTQTGIETVDGFHRGRVGKESKPVRERVLGYLPVAVINSEREDKADRIAATIRHNRARGKHKVEAMSDIVVELKRRNWSDDKIARELGMDADEVLRLCQITGIAELFADQEFSQSWDLAQPPDDLDVQLEDGMEVEPADPGRIYHTYEKWESFAAGFYETKAPDGMSKDDCEFAYRDFLKDTPRFESALERVITEWEKSCEHCLTNESMNRIAWMGQAAMCIATGVPSQFRAGFNLLSETDQRTADETALEYLNKWLAQRGKEPLTWEQAQNKTVANQY